MKKILLLLLLIGLPQVVFGWACNKDGSCNWGAKCNDDNQCILIPGDTWYKYLYPTEK